MHAEGQTPFLRSLAIQARVIGALVLRDLLVNNGRRNIGFLWPFVTTVIFVLAHAIFWASATHGFKNVQVPVMIITGYSFLKHLREAPGSLAASRLSSTSLLLHRNIRVLDIYFAKILLQAWTITMTLVAFTVVGLLAGLVKPLDSIAQAIFAWILLLWFSVSMGLVIGPLLVKSEVMRKSNFTFIYGALTLPFSGALFMVDWLPTHLRYRLLWSPSVNGMEMLREAYLGNVARAHYDVSYMVSACLCLTFFGLVIAKTCAGTIGQK